MSKHIKIDLMTREIKITCDIRQNIKKINLKIDLMTREIKITCDIRQI